MKILSIDDSDINIQYKKSDLNNKYVNKVLNINELYEIFNENPIDIFESGLVTINAISFILKDNKEISLYEYDKSEMPVFLKISDDSLSGNDIIISMSKYHKVIDDSNDDTLIMDSEDEDTCKYFFLANKEAPENPEDYNGYINTQLIIDGTKKTQSKIKTEFDIPNKMIVECPAAMKCHNMKYQLGDKLYIGYIPALGQLKFILKYLCMINYIFKKCDTDFLYLDEDEWWTSTEKNDIEAYMLVSESRGDNDFLDDFLDSPIIADSEKSFYYPLNAYANSEIKVRPKFIPGSILPLFKPLKIKDK